MITKNECNELVIKSELPNKKELLIEMSKLSIQDCIKKLDGLRITSVTDFYEKLRNSYNKGSSKLYKNLLDYDFMDLNEGLRLLSVFQNQAILWSPATEFYKSVRLPEVSYVVFKSITGDTTHIIDTISLIKNDLKVFKIIKEQK